MPIDIGLLKAAARAWKLHDLSDESRSRLEQAGVLDYHKELNGLDRGSDNIFEKVNKRLQAMHPDARLTEEYKPGTSNGSTSMPSTQLGVYRNKADFRAAPNLHIEYGDEFDYKGLKNRNTKTRHLLVSAEENPDPLHKYFRRALIRRHELDEASAVTKRTESKLGVFRNLISPGGSHHDMWLRHTPEEKYEVLDTAIGTKGFRGKEDIYTHANPRVLINESNNLAGAPKSIRDTYTGLRFRPNKNPYRNVDAHAHIIGEQRETGRSASAIIDNMPIQHHNLINEGELMQNSGLNYGTQIRSSKRKAIANTMSETMGKAVTAYKANLIPKMKRFEHLWEFVKRH